MLCPNRISDSEKFNDGDTFEARIHVNREHAKLPYFLLLVCGLMIGIYSTVFDAYDGQIKNNFNGSIDYLLAGSCAYVRGFFLLK